MNNAVASFDSMNAPDAEADQIVGAVLLPCSTPSKVRVRVVVKDWLFGLRRHCPYKLEVGSETFEGETGEAALVDQFVDTAATSGELTVWVPGRKTPLVWTLELAFMDPLGMETGARDRLNNLAFEDTRTAAALEEVAAILQIPKEDDEMEEDGAAAEKKLITALYRRQADDTNTLEGRLALPVATLAECADEGNPFAGNEDESDVQTT